MIEQLLDGLPLNAASFIVTVYGDVVLPRDEVLWMGSLIEICAEVGISENLVRTATSRLVSSGRLEGERSGRRSFYRLAPAARAEFADAARLLYTRQTKAENWFVLHAPNLAQDEVRRHRMARMGGDVWLSPVRGDSLPASALALKVELPIETSELAALAGLWDLTKLQSLYDGLLKRFRPVASLAASGRAIAAKDAFIARLLLVHSYRGVLLRDPCLPEAALPRDWHGTEARDLFRSLYAALSPTADVEIGRRLEGRTGLLPARTAETEARLKALA